jgi:hypothetical protein
MDDPSKKMDYLTKMRSAGRIPTSSGMKNSTKDTRETQRTPGIFFYYHICEIKADAVHLLNSRQHGKIMMTSGVEGEIRILSPPLAGQVVEHESLLQPGMHVEMACQDLNLLNKSCFSGIV